MKKRYKVYTSLLLCIVFFQKNGAAQPTGAPFGLYENYFKLYDKRGINMPSGSDIISNAIFALDGRYRSRILGIAYGPPTLVAGTVWFVNTFTQKKNIVCACTAGHVIEPFGASLNSKITFDAFLNYTGEVRQGTYGPYVHTSSIKNTFHAKIVYQSYDPSDDDAPDITLMLIDKSEISAPYTTLPVSNRNPYTRNPNNPYPLFSMTHPNGMVLRAADSLSFTSAGTNTFIHTGFGNNMVSKGSSGGPVIYKDAAGWFVTGTISARVRTAPDPGTIPVSELEINDEGNNAIIYKGYPVVRSTKISALTAAIMKHCWDNKTEEELTALGLNKQPLSVANRESIDNFKKDVTLNAGTSLASVADINYAKDNPGNTLVKASTLTISCPLPMSPDHEKIYTAAVTTNLLRGFSYIAAGDYELQVNSITLAQPVTSATFAFRKPAVVKTISTDITELKEEPVLKFTISPNPSATGIFDLLTPVMDKKINYRLDITSMDGRKIETPSISSSGNKTRINLSSQPHGAYILSVSDNNQIVYSERLIF